MIKSKIVKSDDDSNEFPKLMKGRNGVVVLMTERDGNNGSGFVVVRGFEDRPIGRHTDTWNMSVFKEFEGSIELSNK